VSSFSKLQTCIQINKNTKVKNKHFIFIIQNNNKNRKHIKIKNKKDKSLFKKLKHEPNIVEITHLCIKHEVQTMALDCMICSCSVRLSQPHFGQVWGWSPTFGKVQDLESSRTPGCLELDNKAQNNLHGSVLGVVEKVLKRRCRKWPRIGHLDICIPSYGQKKGRESNWQFDSRPLKVKNRPVPDVRSGSATWRWKALFEGYNFCSDLVPIRGRGEDVTTLLWAKCGGEAQHFKVGNLESSGILECLELNNKAQNTLHWGFLSVIGKALKRRYRKWTRIGHLDICSPSYGQKKGRESN
jgi:hypothetical protein